MNIGKTTPSMTHKVIMQCVCELMNIPDEQCEILYNHADDPDRSDFLWNRGFKHVYIVGSNFGSAPENADRSYHKAVANYDFKKLACAIHYMADAGQPFHTSFKGVTHHFAYEEYVDNIILDIRHRLYSSIINIDSVSLAVMDLAYDANKSIDSLIDAFTHEEYDTVDSITIERLQTCIGYCSGLVDKFYNDVV